MSNHSGSYILQETLCIAEEMGILETIGEEKTFEFISKLVKLGGCYDCNNGEILGDIGERLGICYCCLARTMNLEYGVCKDCR